jgi:hypothetical protein
MIELLNEFAAGFAAPSDGALPTPVPGTALPAPRQGATVLLATARRSLVTWFRVALATANLNLMVSPDGLHALMSAVHQPPELVILDDDLPGVRADRLEQLLARDARTASTHVMHVKSPPDTLERNSSNAGTTP